jgi:hypothetical protein
MLFDWRDVECSLSFVVVKIAIVVFTTMDSNACMRPKTEGLIVDKKCEALRIGVHSFSL